MRKQLTPSPAVVASAKPPVIGNERVRDFLRRAVTADRLAHGLLFVGPERIGKLAAAREFASSLLGTATPENHPDYFFLERERDRKTGKLHGSIVIEQVQALTGRLALGAFMGGWKICILDGADLLKDAAANALLKTLEEPHEKTVLILLASSADDVLPTVRSRCQVLRFGRVPTAQIAGALASRGTSPAKAELYARLADGRPGAAFAYADEPAILDGMFAMRDAILGFAGSAVADRWAAIERFIPAKLPFQESADRARAFLDVAAEVLRDALLVANGHREGAVHVDARDRLEALAAALGPRKAAAAAEAIGEARRLVDENVNPRSVLERFALSF
jgi:DNA polymerase-3 subunit delta'